jgi:hypothetical protein
MKGFGSFILHGLLAAIGFLGGLRLALYCMPALGDFVLPFIGGAIVFCGWFVYRLIWGKRPSGVPEPVGDSVAIRANDLRFVWYLKAFAFAAGVGFFCAICLWGLVMFLAIWIND